MRYIGLAVLPGEQLSQHHSRDSDKPLYMAVRLGSLIAKVDKLNQTEIYLGHTLSLGIGCVIEVRTGLFLKFPSSNGNAAFLISLSSQHLK